MHLHNIAAKRPVMQQAKLEIYEVGGFEFATGRVWAGKRLATVKAANRRACVLNARVHFSGPQFKWVWA